MPRGEAVTRDRGPTTGDRPHEVGGLSSDDRRLGAPTPLDRAIQLTPNIWARQIYVKLPAGAMIGVGAARLTEGGLESEPMPNDQRDDENQQREIGRAQHVCHLRCCLTDPASRRRGRRGGGG